MIFNFASVWVMTIDRRVLKVKVMVKGQCQKCACCTSTYLPAFVLSVLLHSDCVRACVRACVCVCVVDSAALQRVRSACRARVRVDRRAVTMEVDVNLSASKQSLNNGDVAPASPDDGSKHGRMSVRL